MDKPCLVQINCTPDGSTGNIMEGIRREAEADGWRCYTLCAGTRQAKRQWAAAVLEA